MNLGRLKSDGTPEGTGIAIEPETRAAGEELWWTPAGNTAGIAVSERTALALTPILAAHNTIATDVAVMPLDVFQRQPDGSRRRATEHVNHELLRRSPDRGRSVPVTWRQALMGHALSRGNGYAEIQRTQRGAPYALHLLNPDSTYRRDDPATGDYGYQSGSTWIPGEDVLHIAGFGFDVVTGYNFTRLIAEAIGLGLAEQNYGADFFGNGAEPGAVITFPGKFQSPEKVEEFRSGFEGRHRGPGKRHRTAILQEGADIKTLGIDPESAQLVEARKFQATDVIRPWRLPPNKIGDFSQAHLSNIDAANLDYLMTALLGWLVAIEQQHDLKLLSLQEWRDGYYHRHNLKALLRGDIRTRYAAYEIAVRNGWYSRDEIRAMEEEDPIGDEKGGRLYTVQAQVVPLDKAGVAFEGKANAPTGTELPASRAESRDAPPPPPVESVPFAFATPWEGLPPFAPAYRTATRIPEQGR